MKSDLYPLFLDLHDARCLVAGLGDVGCRKLRGLLDAGAAMVLTFDVAEPSAEAAVLLASPRVRHARRACTEADVAGCRLAFAATGDRAENARIVALCRTHGVLCNCADAPETGNFHVPALARQGELMLALSTGGASPALARRWRRELEDWLAPRVRMARLMGRLRPCVLALSSDSGQNGKLFRSLAESPLQHWLQDGDLEACRAFLTQSLPPELHARIPEFLHDLA